MSSGEAGGNDSAPEPARRSVGDLAELVEMPEDVIRRQMAYWVYKGVVVEVAEVVAGGGSVYELCEEQRLRMDADEVRGTVPLIIFDHSRVCMSYTPLRVEYDSN